MRRVASLSELQQQRFHALIRDVLGGNYLSVGFSTYTVSEHTEGEANGGKPTVSTITCQLVLGGERTIEFTCESEGGPIDALFHGAKEELAAHYPSLGTIRFVDFSYTAEIEDDEKNDRQGSNARGKVQLTIRNSYGREFLFSDISRSFLTSSVVAVAQAIEHFVNAERAVLCLHDWIRDAERRGRPELAERYLQRLADLVQNASYSEAIECKRGQAGLEH